MIYFFVVFLYIWFSKSKEIARFWNCINYKLLRLFISYSKVADARKKDYIGVLYLLHKFSFFLPAAKILHLFPIILRNFYERKSSFCWFFKYFPFSLVFLVLCFYWIIVSADVFSTLLFFYFFPSTYFSSPPLLFSRGSIHAEYQPRKINLCTSLPLPKNRTEWTSRKVN